MTRTMKDSCVEWIGQIPEKWNVKPLYCFFNERKNKNLNGKETNLLSLSYGKIIRKNINTAEGLLPESFNTYNIIEAGDIVFRLTDLQNDKRSLRTGLAKEHGIITSAYVTVKPIKNLINSFFHYLLHSYDVTKVFYNMGNGVRQGLTFDELKKLLLLIPPLSEQQAIADYLDDKCAQIDNITATINEQIEVLKQYKKSVITEAVTKGLDHNVPMKDSGVEWIGKIPEHWTLKPFEFILKERSLKNNPILTDERLALSIDKGITLYSEKTTNLDRFKDDVSLYKVVYPGDFVMNSMNMIVGAVGITPYLGCVSPAYYVFYDENTEHTKARFCDYIFRSKTIRKYLFSIGKGIMAIERGDDRVNTCRLKVSRYDLNKLKIPQPPYIEQTQIVNYLDDKCAKIDAVIADKQAQLETLAAYKKSLIYEYVTGKKSVPGFEEA